MQHVKTADFKPFDAHDWRVGIVVAQFNQPITEQLAASALKRAGSYQLKPENITTVTVAGCVEIPLVLQQLARTKRYDALLALGCVVQGETPHFDYVCKFVTEGVLRVQLDEQIAVGFGVITCHNQAQAEARANLGDQFLDAALQQARSIRQLKKN